MTSTSYATETTCVKEEEQCVGKDGDRVEGDCDQDTCAECSGGCKKQCVKEEERKIRIDTDDEGNPVYDPVLPGNGAFVEGGVDMTVERGGLPLQARRSYNSKSDAGDLGLGHNWDHTLLAHIEDLGSDGVILYKGGGPMNIEQQNGEYQTDGEFELEKVNGKFELTQPNGFKYYFDSNHNIISKVSPQGPYYNWIYDGNQNVTTIQYKGATDVIYADWDTTNHRLTKLTDVQGGGTVEYQYSTASDLTKITGSCGSCSSTAPEGLLYNASHNITSVHNADDEKLHDNQYDSSARVTKQIYQASPEKAYVYDYSQFASGILDITKPDGVTNEYHMDSQNQGTKVVIKNNGIQGSDVVIEQYFDDNGNLTRHVHGNGYDQRFHYNTNGRMTMAVRYDATNPLTISQYEYDANGRPTKYTDGDGTVTAYHYDDSGTGRLTKKVVDPTGLAITESWVYDQNSGLALTHTAPDGTATAFAYDSSGYRTKQIVDPGGLALTTSYLVDAAGRVTKRTDPRGNDWVRLYNAAGKVTKQVAPDGRTVLRTYDNVNRLVTKTVQDAETSPAITRTTTYHYGKYGNLTRRTEPAPGTSERHTDFAYDFLNRRISKTKPTGEQFAFVYNELGKVYQRKAYDGSNWITRATYLYDGDKQVTKKTDANSNVVVAKFYNSYNRMTRKENALGHYRAFEYDAAGRKTRQVVYDNADTAQRESRMAYDAAGRMTRQRKLAVPGGSTSTRDQLVEMAHDDAGRVLTRSTYLSGTTKAQQISEYDAAGRTTRQLQDDGPTVAMAYDNGGNLLTRTVDPGAGGLQIETTFAYDTSGRRTRQTNADLTYKVTMYDGLNRVTKTARYDSGNTAFAAQGRMYDDALNVVTKTFQVHDPATSLAYTQSDDPAQVRLYSDMGRLTAQRDANGNQTDFAYDDMGRRITTTDRKRPTRRSTISGVARSFSARSSGRLGAIRSMIRSVRRRSSTSSR
jgi:YD repeat-containing protein